ncbi:MAG: phosphoribosyltransferase family protein [Vulcanimicrobiota bacterium]
MQVGSLGAYRGALRRAVLRLKESNDQKLAQLLGCRLSQMLFERGLDSAQVVAVPSSVRRLRWRGYSGPERLAAVISQQLGWPLLKGLSCPGDPAPRKALRSFKLRRMHSAHFHWRGPLSGTVVLVDDVVTSGQTLKAARQVLLQAGATRVEMICVARSS